MQFEPNAGQAGDEIKFLSRGAGYSLFLAPTEAILSLRAAGKDSSGASAKTKHPRATDSRTRTTELRMILLGANPQPRIEGADALPGTVNYFLGNDPQQWRAGIPTFGKIKYEQVYPGVDLVYYGNQQQLEYDFIVAENADPNRIQFRFAGADHLEIDDQGRLVAHVGESSVQWRKPFAYQNTDAGRKEISASFVLNGNGQISFQVGAYDTTKPLVIDPVLVYCTYLGGNGDDYVSGIALDASGDVFVLGDTDSINFPTNKPVRPTLAGLNDVFITKFNSNGTALIYSTYFGGSSNDFAGGIAVDANGNAYFTGLSESLNFPTTSSAFKTSNNGGYDTFVTKLGTNGTNIVYSTYLGGTDDDSGNAIAVDNSNNAWFAGDTYSIGSGNPKFPSTQGAYQGNIAGGQDAFIVKINTAASGSSSLVYCTYLGGDSEDKANGITIDSSGNVYVVGTVASFPFFPDPPTSSFPVTGGAFQSSFNRGSIDPLAGSTDGFLTKLNSSGSSLIFSTFLGGTVDDSIAGIKLGPTGRICLVGETSSLDFPVTNAAQSVISGGTNFPPPDAFVAVFQTNGASLLYSTYLGGSSFESGFSFYREGIAVDAFGAIYVTGETTSSDFPLTAGADQTNASGFSDAFVTKINPAVPGRASLIYSTLISGDGDERGIGIAVDTNGNFYVDGITSSTFGFPTTAGAFRSTNSGGFYDAFAAKFSSPPDLSVAITASIEPVIVGSNITFTVFVNNNGRSSFSSVTNSVQLPPNAQLISVTSTKGTWSTNGTTLIFNISTNGVVTNGAAVTHTIVLSPTSPTPLTNTATLTAIETEPNTGNNTAKIVSTVRGIADLAISKSASTNSVFVSSNLVYSVILTNKGPWPATSVTVTDALPSAVKFVSAVPSQGTCTTNAGVITCNLGTVATNSTATVTVNTIATTIGSPTNVAGVTAFELDTISSNNTARVGVTINALSDLTLRKTVSTNFIYAGFTLTYTIPMTNRGPSTATNVVMTDVLPAGFAFVSAQTTRGTISQSNGVVTCNVGTLTSNSTATATINVIPNIAGQITNSAAVTSASTDPISTNNSGFVVTQIDPAADLAVTKTASTNSVFAGNNLTYSVVITNRGPLPAESVVLTDPLPSGAAFISGVASQGACTESNGILTCNIGTLSNFMMATVTIIVKPSKAGAITNTASVSSLTLDGFLTNNTSSVTTTVNPMADLSVSQIAVPNSVVPGTNVVFTVTVLNNGPSTATNIVVTDTLLPGTTFVSAASSQGGCTQTNGVVTCDLGNLASNATATLTITANSSDIGFITNSVSAVSAVTDTAPANNSAAVVVPVTDIAADLAIGKTTPTNSVFAGGNLVYTIAITNLGPASTTGVLLTDTLPPGAQFVSAQSTQGACAETNGVVSCELGDLAINATATVNITVNPVFTGSITNTADAISSLPDLNTTNNSSSVVTTVNPSADLVVIKTASTNLIYAGEDLDYTIVISNRGPSTASSVVLTDPLPQGAYFIASQSSQGNCTQTNNVTICDIGDLDSNATATVTITVSSVIGGFITNTATATSATVDLVSSNNSASVFTTVTPVADIFVSQNPASPDPVFQTSNVTFSVVVANNGPSLAIGVVLTDTLPAGTTFVSAQSDQGNCTQTNGVVTCDIGSVDSDAPITVTITVTANAAGSITNTASATGTRPDSSLANNSASAAATVTAVADLFVSKTVSTNSILLGGSLTYTVIVTNRGPSLAASVLLTDLLPSGVEFDSAQTSQGNNIHSNGVVSCELGDLAVNSTATVIINVNSTAAGPATNTAGVLSDTVDLFLGNNSASAIATVNPSADLIVGKTISTNAVLQGSNLVYTITVTNLGPSAATSVVVTDALPPTLTFVSAETTQGSTSTNGTIVTGNLGTISSGDGAVVTITAKSSVVRSITNTAIATSAVTDTAVANNSDSVIAAVIAVAAPLSDLALGKDAFPVSILVGSNLTYFLLATNFGPQATTNVVITDTLPPQFAFLSAQTSQGTFTQFNGTVTFNVGTVASNATVTATIDVQSISAGPATNTASIVSSITDPFLDNNEATFTTSIIPIADLAMGKRASTNSVFLGTTLTYTINVTNRGPSAATGIVVTDSLPATVAFVSAQTSQGNYSESNGTVTCELGDLASNATATVTINVTALSVGDITNVAGIYSGVIDFNATNNSASAAATINPVANLSITKTASGSPAFVSSNVTFTLTVSNNGPSTAIGVVATDVLPSGFAFVSAETPQGSSSASNGVVTCALDNLDSNATTTVIITAVATGSGIFTNTAAVTSAIADLSPQNNSASAVATNVALADLQLSKTSSTNSVFVGSNLVYTVVVANRGPSTATGVVVTDPLPSGATFVSAVPSQGTCSQTNGIVTCNVGSLASNATATVTITVTATSPGPLVNTANVNSDVTDPTTANDSASVGATVIAAADLSILKTASPGSTLNDSNVTFTIVVTNRGVSPATSVIVSDSLPPSFAFLSAQSPEGSCTQTNGVVTCFLDDLQNGGKATVTIAVRATADGTFTNTASVASGTTDLFPANNSSSAAATINPSADLRVNKTISTNAVVAGSNLVYTITVTNFGPSTATSVVVTDALPSGLTFVSAQTTQGSTSTNGTVVTGNIGTLQLGAGATVTITAKSSVTGSITNTAAATSSAADPVTTNSTDTVIASVIAFTDPLANLVLAKIASTNSILVGSNLTYTIYATNLGPQPATSVVLTDPLPPQFTFLSAQTSQGSFTQFNGTVTFNLGTLASNATATATIDVKSTTDGTTTNTASVSSTVTDPSLDNNSAACIATIVPIADLAMSKRVSTNSVFAGDELIYTITITNHGPSTASGVVVTDALPASVSFVSANTTKGTVSQSGGIVTCDIGALASNATATVAITVSTMNIGSITNTASVSSGVIDFNAANNSDSATTTINPGADLSITKTASDGPTFVSSNITFTIIVSNNGPSTATSVVATDLLPSGFAFVSAQPSQGTSSATNGVVTCNLNNLASNATATVIITAVATGTGTFTNTASATSAIADPASLNNSASAIATNTPLADLQLSKTASASSVFTGSNLVYTVTALNRGPSTATGIVVTDSLPAGVNFVSAVSSQGSSSQTNGVVTCAVGSLASNATATVTITINSTTPGLIVNSASVTSTVTDPVSANNSASASATVVAATDLSVSKLASPNPAFTASNVTFTIIVTNRGAAQANGVVLTDSLPSAFSFLSVQTTQGSCIESNGVVTCNLNSLASGGQATVTILVNAPVDGTFANQAGVTAMEADPATNNNVATVIVAVFDNPGSPMLRIMRSGTNVVLTWTTNLTNFALESKNPFFTNVAWQSVTNVPAKVGNKFTVTNPAVGSGKFYRLTK